MMPSSSRCERCIDARASVSLRRTSLKQPLSNGRLWPIGTAQRTGASSGNVPEADIRRAELEFDKFSVGGQ
jgi:hypothetical protein